jgi:hypothetical protein
MRQNAAIPTGCAYSILSRFLRMIERSVGSFDQVASGNARRRHRDSDTRSHSEVSKILFASLVRFDALTDSLSNYGGALHGSPRHHDRKLFSAEARAYVKDSDRSAKDL